VSFGGRVGPFGPERMDLLRKQKGLVFSRGGRGGASTGQGRGGVLPLRPAPPGSHIRQLRGRQKFFSPFGPTAWPQIPLVGGGGPPLGPMIFGAAENLSGRPPPGRRGRWSGLGFKPFWGEHGGAGPNRRRLTGAAVGRLPTMGCCADKPPTAIRRNEFGGAGLRGAGGGTRSRRGGPGPLRGNAAPRPRARVGGEAGAGRHSGSPGQETPWANSRPGLRVRTFSR